MSSEIPLAAHDKDADHEDVLIVIKVCEHGEFT